MKFLIVLVLFYRLDFLILDELILGFDFVVRN